ncbi:hypothetical protein LJC56_01435 [Christensenellaceae bacterium OttesenSCG-928-K19]|nr:hypothetical protein [Christensenellaceae bacterium OttesenSCG-928-K19]
MKKSLFGIVLVVIMLAVVFSGCTDVQEPAETAMPETTQEQEQAPTEEPIPEPTEEATPELTQEQESEPTKDGDISADPGEIVPVETMAENPAKIGEWVETKRYSTESGNYHTVFYRILNIERGDAALSAVQRYNDEGHVTYFEEIEDSDLEYCLLTYEVYFPEEFPAGDLGITMATIELGATNPAGGGITANGRTYIGLGATHDISPNLEAKDLYPGDTWVGEAIFAMAKDYSDYVIETYYFDEDNERISSFIEGK